MAFASGEEISRVGGLLAERAGNGARTIVVVSAMPGVTDLLFDSIRLRNYSSVYTKLLTSHQSAARRALRAEGDRKAAIQDVTDMLDSYRWLGKSLMNRTPTPVETEIIGLLGERLCARLLAANIQSRGVRSVTLNAGELLVADAEATRARVQSRLLPLLEQGYLPVVTASPDAERAPLAASLKPPDRPLCAVSLAAGVAESVQVWSDAETYSTFTI
jgi:aspartokinase